MSTVDDESLTPRRWHLASLPKPAVADLKDLGDRSARDLKDLEENEVKGADVVVNFHLPDGSKESASFPTGQAVAFLKGHIESTRGIPISEQIFSFEGVVLIDPMSLIDYEGIRMHKGPLDIEVKLVSDTK